MNSRAHYDVAIIGAGLSGLAAGVRLAHFGQKVCIFERHNAPGGLNSFYSIAGRKYDVGLHAVTNFVKPFTVAYLVKCAGKNCGAIERVFLLCFIQLQSHYLLRNFFQNHCQQAIVCTANIVPVVLRQQQMFRLFVKQIYHHQMKGSGRKIFNSVPAHIGCLRKIKRRKLVCNIYQCNKRRMLQQLTFHRAGKKIMLTNIGCKGK